MILSISSITASRVCGNSQKPQRPFLRWMCSASGAVFSALALVLLSAPSPAAPRAKSRRVATKPMGRSALAAARLKTNPPRGWIRHYLPADRFKIAGGIWKYVSTELDTFYHRPDSVYMMQQPAGLVIGFASIADAEEAGYRPGPGISARRRSEALVASPLFGGRVGTPSSGNGDSRGMSGSNDSVVVREKDIPPEVLKLIRTVDALSEQILSASSNAELNRVARKVALFGGSATMGAARTPSGAGQSAEINSAATGIAQTLQQAIDAKRGGGNAAGIPVVQQLLNAAKSGARALVPGAKESFFDAVGRNSQNMLNRNPNNGPIPR